MKRNFKAFKIKKLERKNGMKKQKKNAKKTKTQGKKIAVIIAIFAVLVAVGFCVILPNVLNQTGDKESSDAPSKESATTSSQITSSENSFSQEVSSENNSSNESEIVSQPIIIDAVSYEREVIPYKDGLNLNGKKHSIKIPKINRETPYAKAFNEKLYNTSKKTISMLKDKQEGKYIFNTEYKYRIENDVLGIFIIEWHTLQEGATFGNYHAFYYDLKEDEELEFEDYLAKFGTNSEKAFSVIQKREEYTSEYSNYKGVELKALIINDQGANAIFKNRSVQDGWSQLALNSKLKF